MRFANNFLLAITAYTANFLATESYSLKPIRSPTTAKSSSAVYLDKFTGISSIQCRLLGHSSRSSNIQLNCSGKDDNSFLNRPIIARLQKILANIITVLMFCLIGARGAVARPPRSSKTDSSPQKSVVTRKSNGRVATKARPSKKVEVEIVIDRKGDMNKKLTELGLVLVGVSTVATLLTGDEKKGKGKKNLKSSKRSTPVELKPRVAKFDNREEEDEDKDDEDEDVKSDFAAKMTEKYSLEQNKPGVTGMSKRFKKEMGAINKLPSAEDLFDSKDSDDFFSDEPNKVEPKKAVSKNVDNSDDNDDNDLPTTPVPRKTNKFGVPPSVNRKVEMVNRIESLEEFDDEDDTDDDVPQSLSQPPPTPSKARTPIPLPPPAKKSIFDRIFNKQSTSRPTNLGEVIAIQDAATDFRSAAATILTTYLPAELQIFPDVQVGGVFSYSGEEDSVFEDEDRRVILLVRLMDDCELQSKEAANAFGDVTNAMLVSLTDRCVDVLDKKGKKSTDQDEDTSLFPLDLLTKFATAAGALFGKVLPGVIIEDGGIKYNGKAKKDKLETLFYNYMKAGMGVDAMKGLMGGEAEGEGEVEESAALAATIAEGRQERMYCLQQVFSISEGKRGSLEQKAMKDMIMGMMGGGGGVGGGMPDFASMMGNMGKGGGGGGKGGDMGGMDEAAFAEMMKDFEKNGGGGGEGDMDPAEMAGMLSESLGQMKQQLKDGSLNKENILELEKSMGMGLKEMVGMVEMAKKMAGKQKIPEIDEMLSLFKQLLALKN